MSEYFFPEDLAGNQIFVQSFLYCAGCIFQDYVQFDSGLVQVRETHAIATVLWTLIDLLVDDLLFS
jgi:hypothetical protein